MSNYTNFKYLEDPNMPWHKIINLIPDNSRVLDIGCSSGNLGHVLKVGKNCEVVGIDLDEKDVAEAKKQLDGAHVKNIENDDLGFLGKFDCVIYADVIEHLMDPVEALKKTKTLLKDNGSVLFSIPNMAHMGTRLLLMSGRFSYGEIGLLDKTHIRFYDHQEIERVFLEAGFEFENFDWIERYIPEYLLIQQLEDIGLKPNKEFIEKNKMVEAMAYEYIGKAVVSSKPKKLTTKLDFISPYVLATEERIDQLQQSYKDQIKNLNKEIKELNQRLSNLAEEHNSILSSTSWKATKPLRAINRKAKSTKNA